MVARLFIVALAGVAAVIPTPAAWVERVYSNGAYLYLQNVLTPVSNRTPVPIFDLGAALLGGGLLAWWVMRVRFETGVRTFCR